MMLEVGGGGPGVLTLVAGVSFPAMHYILHLETNEFFLSTQGRRQNTCRCTTLYVDHILYVQEVVIQFL